jgi:predicted CoA-substrate-specific enzyme activase
VFTLVTAGIDIGSLTSKAIVLDADTRQVLGSCLTPTGSRPQKAGPAALHGALDVAGIAEAAIDASVGTGYGRNCLEQVTWRITEISCHARGAFHLASEVRTVVDLGGQDAKVISLDEAGRALDFEMNDRCAAGTGRFLEVMAAALDLDIGQLGSLAWAAEQPASLSSTCTVFAESEVIGLLADGREVGQIAAGLCEVIAHRTMQMANRLQIQPLVMMTGGVAHNIGVKKAMEQALGMEIVVPPEPQLVGALGAAILAAERAAAE